MKQLVLIFILILSILTTFAHRERWDENKNDWSPLMLAIYKDQQAKFTKLLEAGIDINYTTPGTNSNWRLTALDVAIRMDNEVAVNMLLRTNKILHPETFLMTACAGKSVSNVNQLIKYGANPKDTLENGYSVLMMAASFGTGKIIETLLNQGADHSQTRKVDGITPLMLAAGSGDPDKVRLLLDNGADKGVKDKNGNTALYYVENIPERMNVSLKKKAAIKKFLS